MSKIDNVVQHLDDLNDSITYTKNIVEHVSDTVANNNTKCQTLTGKIDAIVNNYANKINQVYIAKQTLDKNLDKLV